MDYWVDECSIPESTNASTFSVHDLFSLIQELSGLFHHFEMKNDLLIYCVYNIRQHESDLFGTLLIVQKKRSYNS